MCLGMQTLQHQRGLVQEQATTWLIQTGQGRYVSAGFSN